MEPNKMICPYCDNDHSPTELCRAQKVNRRTFIFSSLTTLVGLSLTPNFNLGIDWGLEEATSELFLYPGTSGLGKSWIGPSMGNEVYDNLVELITLMKENKIKT